MTSSSGTKLSHYEILEPLGAGGMGEVYRARDIKLERGVAIKVLPEELTQDRERLRRFEREAKLLAALNHPAIAHLYGFEEESGTSFLVMELVEGETLADRIARGPIPLDEAIPLFIQIAEGIEAAHDKGIVHRDLKPANVMITPEGRSRSWTLVWQRLLPTRRWSRFNPPFLRRLQRARRSASSSARPPS
jgi:serine/threonine protein kinase